jgi:alkaline phosphatase
LLGVKESAGVLSSHLLAFARSIPHPAADEIKRYIEEQLLIGVAGFTPENGGLPTSEEVERLFGCLRSSPSSSSLAADPPIDTADDCRIIFADLVSRRAEIGWSTSGHTGVDVPVHVLGSNDLKGNMENTEVCNAAREWIRGV